jgi:3'-phosphoadenosine 5'-phosphosulfate sulfotransferase (PAPS reductase)/FAD synthetase
MLGMLTKDQQIKANIPSKDRSQFAQTKWKFMLEAPFEISNRCCNVMKKSPMHTYSKKTGRYAITAQMASESRLRAQKWIQFGCNMFDAKNPVSNPMSFWFEQDVLLYAKLNNIRLCSVYGDIVTEDGSEFNPEGQMDLAIFDEGRIGLKTTGCNRTGCCMCGFGVHLEQRPNRFELIEQFSNPSIQDYVLRGGDFDENGLWKPARGGLGYWFVMQYLNVHDKNTNIYIPNYEEYEKKYGNEMTSKYLKS